MTLREASCLRLGMSIEVKCDAAAPLIIELVEDGKTILLAQDGGTSNPQTRRYEVIRNDFTAEAA